MKMRKRMRMKNVQQQHELWKEAQRTCQRATGRPKVRPTQRSALPPFASSTMQEPTMQQAIA